MVETWTLFGTYIPLREYVRMTRSGLVTAVVKTFGPYRLLRRLVLTAPRLVRVLRACTRMTAARWDHFDYANYWDVPLVDIRREFGVRLV